MTYETIKQEGGWLYRGVFIAKGKGGFSFTLLTGHSPKGASWLRLVPDTLTAMKVQIDNYYAEGFTVENRRMKKAGA